MVDLNNQLEIAEYVKSRIGEHKQFALASVGEDSKPWVVCLNLAYDNHCNIIWKSEKSTEHSKNVRNNPEVSICIFSENKQTGDFGLYLRAKAHEVNDPDELAKLLPIRYERSGKPAPPAEELLGGATSRIYFAEVYEAYLNDDRHIKTRVDLEALKRSF